MYNDFKVVQTQIHEGYKLVHERSTNVPRVFYQFHKPSKLVHDSTILTWHVAHLNFFIVHFYL